MLYEPEQQPAPAQQRHIGADGEAAADPRARAAGLLELAYHALDIAAEIAEDLRAALEQFEAIAADLAPAN